MRTTRRGDVTLADELDYLGRLASTRALPSHLLARIARRPGRWRRKMRSRADWQETTPAHLDEAA